MNRAQLFSRSRLPAADSSSLHYFPLCKEPDAVLGSDEDQLNLGHCYFVFALAVPKML
jgi:hypothetical protein